MTESTDKPPRPRSLVEALVGEQNPRNQEKHAAITLRIAEAEARHNRIRNVMSTVLIVMFTLAVAFGFSMGCIAMWNAVVG